MDIKIAVRMIAVLAIGAGLTATAYPLERSGEDEPPIVRLPGPGGEPGRAELRHCRDLGKEALSDRNCRKAWMESRSRFLETSPQARTATPLARPRDAGAP